jgi:hypothetical protein
MTVQQAQTTSDVDTREDAFPVDISLHRSGSVPESTVGLSPQQKSALLQMLRKQGFSESSVVCNATFGHSFKDDVRKVSQYPYAASAPYLTALGLSDEAEFQNEANIRKFPVFLTAASSNHFGEVQALIENIHQTVLPHVKDLKLIMYDIGLSPGELNMSKLFCAQTKCEVRTFPFSHYPPHVRQLLGYAWKPIIIQTVLKEYDFVWWMDSSIGFKTGNLSVLVKAALKYGVQGIITARRPNITDYDILSTMFTNGSITARTDTRMFDFLGESPCLFRRSNEIGGGFNMWLRTPFTTFHILRPWVSCALSIRCMALPGSNRQCPPAPPGSGEISGCHRYDQSALGIIITRLFHRDISEVIMPNTYYDIRRGSPNSNYFLNMVKTTHKQPI